MSDFSDRLDRIREGKNKCYEYNQTKGIPVNSLPQMHKDLHWLLDIVDMFLDEQQCEQDLHNQVSECKMKHIMNKVTSKR